MTVTWELKQLHWLGLFSDKSNIQHLLNSCVDDLKIAESA